MVNNPADYLLSDSLKSEERVVENSVTPPQPVAEPSIVSTPSIVVPVAEEVSLNFLCVLTMSHLLTSHQSFCR